MSDTMVTARMSVAKKDAGNRILDQLGITASRAINELYDYLLDHRSLPWDDPRSCKVSINQNELEEALVWVDGLSVDLSSEYQDMSIKDAKRARLGAM